MDIDSARINFDQGSIWILNVCLALVMLGVSLDLKVEDFKRILVIQPAASIALGMIVVVVSGFAISYYWSRASVVTQPAS